MYLKQLSQLKATWNLYMWLRVNTHVLHVLAYNKYLVYTVDGEEMAHYVEVFAEECFWLGNAILQRSKSQNKNGIISDREKYLWEPSWHQVHGTRTLILQFIWQSLTKHRLKVKVHCTHGLCTLWDIYYGTDMDSCSRRNLCSLHMYKTKIISL